MFTRLLALWHLGILLCHWCLWCPSAPCQGTALCQVPSDPPLSLCLWSRRESWRFYYGVCRTILPCHSYHPHFFCYLNFEPSIEHRLFELLSSVWQSILQCFPHWKRALCTSCDQNKQPTSRQVFSSSAESSLEIWNMMTTRTHENFVAVLFGFASLSEEGVSSSQAWLQSLKLLCMTEHVLTWLNAQHWIS